MRVGTRWCGSVALRVVPVGGWRGSSPRVAVGVASGVPGHGGSCRWCSAWRRWWRARLTAARCRWWVALGGPGHGARSR
ncbi:hypothetical protein C1280_10245 [Gemmata obscuriglobus]|uniref:Uncharacterized protein n=1 Tax=Gemmata obscuriglobus TaxID=114 RepID=A0A2Z3H2K1_9BACT|nr:hypothetical protein C1280_10245 [Gemmata obscuriglobus]